MHSSEAKKESESSVLTSLYSIGLALTSNLDLPAVLELVGEGARKILRADIAACHSYDKETNSYFLLADIGDKLVPKLQRVPRPDGPTATIARTGKVIIANNAPEDPTPYRESPFTKVEAVKSVIGLPLRYRDEIVGVLHINYRARDRITPEIRRNAELLASQAAIAIFNARLFQRLLDREAAMSRLVEVGQNVSEAIAVQKGLEPKPTVRHVLDEIARTACELIDADCAVIYPYDSTRNEYYEIENIGAYGVTKPFSLNEKPRVSGMAAYIKREGLVVRNDIEAEDPNMLKSAFVDREGIRAFAGVDVQAQDTHLGILYVSFRSPHFFAANEIDITKLFANQVAVALQIARLLEREQTARVNLEALELLNKVGSALAHRAVNIAAIIPLYVEKIRDRMEELKFSDARILQSLTSIEEPTTQLVNMARTLRKLPELMGPAEPAAINEILSSVMRAEVRAPVKLRELYESNLPITNVPKPQIAEVFANIVKNAVEKMPDGGKLTVKTRLTGQRTIEVRIADTGPGMERAKVERIFDLFYTEKHSGLGFGLWWSRTFARRIGGDVTVVSTPGRGSTFTVTVPVISPD